MNSFRFYMRCFVILSTFFCGLFCASQGSAQGQKIRISLSSRSNTNASFYVAQAKGFFKEEGLEVEFIQINPRLGAMAVLNGDVTFTTSFVSTFRGIVQGLPMKTVFILLKKGTYYLMVRPDLVKDIQDLKGKKLGVTAVRFQAAVTGAVQAVSVPPPYDLMLEQKGLRAISGPPEIGVPSSGLFAADKFIKEQPPILRRTIRALLKANRFIGENREETIRVMTKFVPQSTEIAGRSYDTELKALAKDGQMTDAEIEFQMDRLAEKRRPLDEVRDFSFARQALKELEAGEVSEAEWIIENGKWTIDDREREGRWLLPMVLLGLLVIHDPAGAQIRGTVS